MEEKNTKVEVLEEVKEETTVDSKKMKRKAIIKNALIALGGLAAVGAIASVVLKKDEETIDEFSLVDLEKHGVIGDSHLLDLEPMVDERTNLYKVVGVRSAESTTESSAENT